jgi:hypothetical protein
MTTEETFKPEESLAVISSMINTAKNKLADDGFYLIFWGWLVFAAAMIHYVTLMMGTESGFWVWPVLMPLGGIISVIYGYKKGKKETVKTYLETYLGYLWGGFGIGMGLILGFMAFHGIKMTYFMLMILYGIATFVSGGLLNFRPLIIGSFFSFAAAVVSVFVGNVEQLPCIAAALLFSYIIPGHMLRAKYKSQQHV